MKLTCETLPAIACATEADIERIIGGDLFGGYAALHQGEEAFLQVGLKGHPPAWAFHAEPGTWERDFAEGCKAFTERTGSRLWGLDYLDPTSGQCFDVEGYQTLREVTQAFLEYLRGDASWRTRYPWRLAESNRGRLREIPR